MPLEFELAKCCIGCVLFYSLTHNLTKYTIYSQSIAARISIAEKWSGFKIVHYILRDENDWKALSRLTSSWYYKKIAYKKLQWHISQLAHYFNNDLFCKSLLWPHWQDVMKQIRHRTWYIVHNSKIWILYRHSPEFRKPVT